MNRNATTVTIMATSSALLALHAAYYYPFVPDDAFISLRYAERLLAGAGLTWTSGPPVEGYSNLLWILLVAGLGRFGLDLVTAARLLGALSSCSVIAALGFGSLRYRLWSPRAAGVACAVWALSAPAAAWTLAGLEHTMVAGLLAWAVVLCLGIDANANAASSNAVNVNTTFRTLQIPGTVLGALVLVRLDAPLFAVVIAVWWWWNHGRDRTALRQSLALLVLPGLALAAQEAFRIAYYADWVPNVARAKLVLSTTHLLSGLRYAGAGLASLRPVGEATLGSLVWLVVRPPMRRRASLLACLTATWLAYVILVGRDLFPAWRQLIPALLGLSLVAAIAVDASHTDRPRRDRLIMSFIGLALVVFTWNQFRNAENQRAKTERWEWNGEVVGRALHDGFGPQEPLLAVMAGGAVPYWAKIDCLDMFGLTDPHIARVRSAEWGEGKLGHETRDAEYVLSRRPDIILFGTPGGYEPDAYDATMQDMPAFRDNYRRCNISGDDPSFFVSRVWINHNSARIGMRRDGASLEIPSYLLNITGGAIARLDAQKRFFVEAKDDSPVGIGALQLEAGSWIVAAPIGSMRVLVNDPDKGFREAFVDDGVRRFVIDAAGTYDVLVVPLSETLRVHRLLLVKESPDRWQP